MIYTEYNETNSIMLKIDPPPRPRARACQARHMLRAAPITCPHHARHCNKSPAY